MSVVARFESLRTLPTDEIRQLMWGPVDLSAHPISGRLLSAVEPILRYHRSGVPAGASAPGSPEDDVDFLQREDALNQLVDVWAAGEASASLDLATARVFEELERLERRNDLVENDQDALEYLKLAALPPTRRNQARFEELESAQPVKFTLLRATANVLGPAAKLWTVGHASAMLREAISLGGRTDAQYEGVTVRPEAAQRHQLAVAMRSRLFLGQFQQWIRAMRAVANNRPGTGACTLASAMQLWYWTVSHVQQTSGAGRGSLYEAKRPGVAFPLADALCWLLAVRSQILDVVELDTRVGEQPRLRESSGGCVSFLTNLCHVQAARAAGEAARICTDVVYGYNRHPSWDDACAAGCCSAEEADDYDALFPGFAATSRMYLDVLEPDGSHATKAGPCARFPGLQRFQMLRAKLDGCLTGSRLARDLAAQALTQVTIPEAPNHPA